MYFPSVKEQEKISELFSLLNKKIELQQKKIEVLKMYKKGLMQKLINSHDKLPPDGLKAGRFVQLEVFLYLV